MLASENAYSFDLVKTRPPVPVVEVVHPEGDGILPEHELRNMAEKWGVNFTLLSSSVAKGIKAIYFFCLKGPVVGSTPKELLYFPPPKKNGPIFFLSKF